MATRLRRPAVADRLLEARKQLDAVNAAILAHVKLCARCTRARGQTRELCDAGWDLAKQQARAGAAIRRAEQARAAAPVQGTLW